METPGFVKQTVVPLAKGASVSLALFGASLGIGAYIEYEEAATHDQAQAAVNNDPEAARSCAKEIQEAQREFNNCRVGKDSIPIDAITEARIKLCKTRAYQQVIECLDSFIQPWNLTVQTSEPDGSVHDEPKP